MPIKILLSLMVALFSSVACSTTAAKPIIDNGKANAVIVTAVNPPRTVTMAAQELQTVLEKITGAKLPIVHQPAADGQVNIYVGQSTYTDKLGLDTADLKYGAHHIKAGDNWLALVGADKDFSLPEPHTKTRADYDAFYKAWDAITGEHFDNPISATWRKADRTEGGTGMWEQDLDNAGSFFAVHRFLHNLGARWYMFGELGEILPELKTVELPTIDVTRHPQFGLRNLYVMGSNFFGGRRDRIMWQLRLGANQGFEQLGITTNISVAHGTANVVKRPETKVAHPEYYSLRGGKPITESLLGKPGPGVPSLVSEELVQANVRYLRHMFDTYDLPVVSVGPTDGFTFLDERPAAQKFASPERGWKGTMSNYVWDYSVRVANELKKTHPNKKISVLAYSTYQLPPEHIEKLPDNIVVGIAQARVYFIDPKIQNSFHELRQDWLRRMPSGEKFWQYEYYLQGWRKDAYQGVPVYFPHIIAEDLRALKDISMGDYIELFPSPANMLNAWITAELYWDVDQDVDALIEEYTRLFYGPAASQMRAFIDYSEKNWKQIPQTKEEIDKVFAMIHAARETAGDTMYGKRIDLMIDFMQPMIARKKALDVARENIVPIKAVEVDQPITIDGKLDEAFWSKLPAYAMNSIEKKGEKPAVNTTVKLAWNQGALVIGIRADEPLMPKVNLGQKEDGDTNWFHYDGVEVMIETPRVSHYQMGISPRGFITDLSRMGTFEYGWDAQATIKSTIDDNGYTLEIRLPAAGEERFELEPFNGVAGDRPTSDKPWYINVGRLRLVAGERETFSITGQGFHDKLKYFQLTTQEK